MISYFKSVSSAADNLSWDGLQRLLNIVLRLNSYQWMYVGYFTVKDRVCRN